MEPPNRMPSETLIYKPQTHSLLPPVEELRRHGRLRVVHRLLVFRANIHQAMRDEGETPSLGSYTLRFRV